MASPKIYSIILSPMKCAQKRIVGNGDLDSSTVGDCTTPECKPLKDLFPFENGGLAFGGGACIYGGLHLGETQFCHHTMTPCHPVVTEAQGIHTETMTCVEFGHPSGHWWRDRCANKHESWMYV